MSTKLVRRNKRYVAIDPGATGCITSVRGMQVRYYPIPEDDIDLYNIMWEFEGCPIAVEKVHSSPQMGVASAFSFGGSYHRVRMAATFVANRVELIRPQEWIRGLNIPPKKPNPSKKNRGSKGCETQAQWKDRLVSECKRLFPRLDCWSQTKTLQRTVADSILIAEYYRRKCEGKL